MMLFQGLWTDFSCKKAYWTNDVNDSIAERDVICKDCGIRLHTLDSEKYEGTHCTVTLAVKRTKKTKMTAKSYKTEDNISSKMGLTLKEKRHTDSAKDLSQ
jgi:hypothetical protein